MTGCADRLVKAGYEVHGIDCEGHGKSSGLLGLINSFDDLVDDLSEHFTNISGEIFLLHIKRINFTYSISPLFRWPLKSIYWGIKNVSLLKLKIVKLVGNYRKINKFSHILVNSLAFKKYLIILLPPFRSHYIWLLSLLLLTLFYVIFPFTYFFL